MFRWLAYEMMVVGALYLLVNHVTRILMRWIYFLGRLNDHSIMVGFERELEEVCLLWKFL